MDGPGTVRVTPVMYGEGGGGGYSSYRWRVAIHDGPGTVRVTPVYGDTLT